MSFTPYTINPELDLELVRDVPVSAEAVFSAWTDPESLKHWFAPRPYTVPLVEIASVSTPAGSALPVPSRANAALLRRDAHPVALDSMAPRTCRAAALL